MSVPHFIITRLGIGIQSQSWFDRKFELMNAITLSSIKKQTSQAFHWMIVTDRNIPATCRTKLQEYLQGHDNIHIVDLDPAKIMRMEHGGLSWVFDPCREYILANGLIEDPTQYVVTSLLDDDDAWHIQTVEIIDQVFSDKTDTLVTEEAKRPHAVRHTSGLVATFKQGLIWNFHSHRYRLLDRPFNSMSIFVLHRFSSGLSACTSRHLRWPDFCRVTEFKPLIIEGKNPMWVYFRHPDTISRASDKDTTPVSDDVLTRFQEQYGIQVEKIPALRKVLLEDASRVEHSQYSAEEHYNNQFKLTAYNQQIDALDRNIQFQKEQNNLGPDKTGYLEKLLKEARVKQKELKALYVKNAEQYF